MWVGLRKREKKDHSPNRSGRLEQLDKRVVHVKEGVGDIRYEVNEVGPWFNDVIATVVYM